MPLRHEKAGFARLNATPMRKRWAGAVSRSRHSKNHLRPSTGRRSPLAKVHQTLKPVAGGGPVTAYKSTRINMCVVKHLQDAGKLTDGFPAILARLWRQLPAAAVKPENLPGPPPLSAPARIVLIMVGERPTHAATARATKNFPIHDDRQHHYGGETE